jgi:PPK2 family polyphosphate:nucleotide phosphotransferase
MAGKKTKGRKQSEFELEHEDTLLVKAARKLARRYRVDDGSRFSLADFDPGDTAGFDDEDKPAAKSALGAGVELLARLQERLWAQDRYAALFVFQAMDAAGKDGAIKHVLSGVNPQGCQVVSFKSPTPEELDHDFLWRCQRQLPERGRIGIFNRSYYEETLVVRVHPEYLERQRLPASGARTSIWEERYQDIRGWERYLGRNGVVVRKIFLHVSKAEQKRRFLDRIDDPAKSWKFSAGDVAERAHWKEYMAAYEETIRGTATKEAPWYVVPADNKWFTRIVVASAVIDTLASLELAIPALGEGARRELAAARRRLLSEK